MDYRNLGRAGLKVSEICLGTMTFGNGADQDGATKMVNAALDAGVTFFDTANSYVGGTSETMLGVALKGQAAGRHHRLEVLQSDGRPAQRFGHVAAAHQAADRGPA